MQFGNLCCKKTGILVGRSHSRSFRWQLQSSELLPKFIHILTQLLDLFLRLRQLPASLIQFAAQASNVQRIGVLSAARNASQAHDKYSYY